jgi:hypothetical protein
MWKYEREKEDRAPLKKEGGRKKARIRRWRTKIWTWESHHSTSKRWYSSVEVRKNRPVGSQLTYNPITFYLHLRKITKIAT